MLVERLGRWIYYTSDDYVFNNEVTGNSGKWMYFFDDITLVENVCELAIEDNIVLTCKHTNAPTGVACFYVDFFDMAAHKRVIQFFMDNDLIRKTKKGKYYNISFKLDAQTRSGEYGDDFEAQLKLSDLLNLDTGEWIV